jgi:hypothetical protein
MNDLDEQLLAAHEAKDLNLLVDLYQQAASATDGDEAKYFYLTHAYIFALDAHHPDRKNLKASLIAAGRES